MSDERPSEVLGGLPRTRPHRRSVKRAAPAATSGPATPGTAGPSVPAPGTTARPAASAAAPGATKRATPRSASRVRQPAQPPGTPAPTSSRRPIPSGGADLIGSAVNVTAELAEIGISAGARALRSVVARLPKP